MILATSEVHLFKYLFDSDTDFPCCDSRMAHAVPKPPILMANST